MFSRRTSSFICSFHTFFGSYWWHYSILWQWPRMTICVTCYYLDLECSLKSQELKAWSLVWCLWEAVEPGLSGVLGKWRWCALKGDCWLWHFALCFMLPSCREIVLFCFALLYSWTGKYSSAWHHHMTPGDAGCQQMVLKATATLPLPSDTSLLAAGFWSCLVLKALSIYFSLFFRKDSSVPTIHGKNLMHSGSPT